MKTKLLLVFFLFFIKIISADEIKEKSTIDDFTLTTIVDLNFEQALIDLGYDTGVPNGTVPTINISSITTLNVSDPLNNTALPNVLAKIKDLTGIEDFIALKSLNFNNNLVTSANLTQNVLLEDLRFTRNTVSTIDLSNNLKLKVVYADDNQLTGLDVTNNIDLEILFCGKNSISTLDVTKNIAIHSLAIDNNLFTNINLCFNINLITFIADYNNLVSLDLSANTMLTSLGAINNNLQSLNVANGNNANIYNLFIINNPMLTCITVDLGTPTTGLTGWTFDGQHTFNPTLCSSSLTYVPDNNLENYLETHNANGVFVGLGATTSMGNGISNDNYVFTNRINSVIKLEVPSLSIADITGIEDFVNLQHLNCYDNTIASLSLTKNPLLTYLKCDSNKITNLDVTNCPNLNFLACNVNQLPALDVSQNTFLTILDCDTNQISNLDVTNNPILHTLDAQGNLLTSLNVSLNPLLFTLVCSDNQITTIDVTANTKLNAFNCSKNLLTSLDLTSNIDLEILDLSKNSISTIDLTSNLKLEIVGMAENLFSQIDIKLNSQIYNFTANNNPNLSSLNIANGNNASFTFLQIVNNPLLNCIIADAITPVTGLTGWNKDAQHMFSATCNALSCIADVNTTAQNTTLTVSATNGLLANDTGTLLMITDFAVNGTTSAIGNTFNLTEGNITINADGSYTFVPTTNFTGSVPQITYTLTDGTTSVTCTLDITVTSTNNTPVCNADTAVTLEDTPLNVNAANGLLANDTDADGDTLTVSDIIVQGTSFTVGAAFGATGVGTITIFADGSYNFTPDPDYNGSFFPINYTISDGNGGTSTCTFNLTITAVNDAPVAVDDLVSGNTANLITTNDTDVDGTVDATSVTLIDPSNITNTGNVTSPLIVAGIGTFTIDASGTIAFTADASFTGTSVTINYTVNDNDGLTSNSATITFNLSSCTITLIPDANFEQRLIDLNIDSDGVINGKVCTSDINSLTTLSIMFASISDLTGIEDFRALTFLNANFNQLTSVNLIQNTLLKGLSIANNQIVSVDLTSNTNLTDLNLANNLIENIDLSNNLSLEYLHLDNTKLDNLDFTNHTTLKSVRLYTNDLESLDLRNTNNSILLTYSTKLNPRLNCVAVDDVNHFNTNFNLGGIFLDSQTSFNTDCSAVWTIMTSPATTAALLAVTPSIDTDGTPGISLAEAAAYTGTLDLSNTGITDVAGLLAFSSITTLDISGNGITDISSLTGSGFGVISKTGQIKQVKKSATMGLQNIILSDNNFEVLDLNSFSNLTSLDISNNPDLITVNLKNGNNRSITTFTSENTPKLSCILVDDVNATVISTWKTDAKNVFVASEVECRAKVLSTENFLLNNGVFLYPNPVSDVLNIELNTSISLEKVEMFSITGKLIFNSDKNKIEVSSLSKGIYLVKIITDKGILTKKIVKK